MTYDVSVLIPAHAAGPYIDRAVASVLAQDGVRAQVVIAADDAEDYLALLRAHGVDCSDIICCRTPAPRSGPAVARNLAAACATAPILAALDADDAYCPGRLALLVPAAARHGAATGETIEMFEGERKRIGRPPAGSNSLELQAICGLRIPFSPVFRRELLGEGWPNLAFAEDMVFNFGLALRAERYAFVEGAGYIYNLRHGSLTESEAALERALRGYAQILTFVDEAPWPPDARSLLRRAIREDIAAVEAAQAGSGASWREAMLAAAQRPSCF